MPPFEARFQVISSINCPHYQPGDRFILSDSSLALVSTGMACLTLVRSFTEMLFAFKMQGADTQNTILSCTGCSGLIKFQRIDALNNFEEGSALSPSKVGSFSVFRGCRNGHLKELLAFFTAQKLEPEDIVVDPHRPLKDFILVTTGLVEVTREDQEFSLLQKGDIVGELSVFGGDPRPLKIRALKKSVIIRAPGHKLGESLHRFPAFQAFLTWYVASKLHMEYSRPIQNSSISLSGQLREFPPDELLQTIHSNKKTGTLSLTYAGGKAAAFFRQGQLVYATHGPLHKEDAFYQILTEKEGSFQFSSQLPLHLVQAKPIGNFMNLLLKGVHRMDEMGEQRRLTFQA